MSKNEPAIVQHSATFDGSVWYLDREVRLTNSLERLKRFYGLHLNGSDDLLSPIASILNPERNGVRCHPYDDVWLLPYYGDFRINVIKHHRFITGPHGCRLYYQSQQNRGLYWIATLQIDDAMFYNIETVQQRLNDGIKAYELYIAPASYGDTVAY